MACERNRIIELVKYIESCGIEVNLAKNKARGNKGFFRAKNNVYRIDISKNIDEISALRTLVHEFIHFVHYKHDKTLKSLDFLFNDINGIYEEELLNLTVDSIPKSSIAPLFEMKDKYNGEADFYYNLLKINYPDIKKSEPYKKIEKYIKDDLKYLLKYDKVKVLKGLSYKIYSVDTLSKDFSDTDENIKNYVKLKYAQRNLKRINSRIARLNRYYNSPTELFARSFEYYIFNPEKMKENAPNLFDCYKKTVSGNKIPMLTKLVESING